MSFKPIRLKSSIYSTGKSRTFLFALLLLLGVWLIDAKVTLADDPSIVTVDLEKKQMEKIPYGKNFILKVILENELVAIEKIEWRVMNGKKDQKCESLKCHRFIQENIPSPETDKDKKISISIDVPPLFDMRGYCVEIKGEKKLTKKGKEKIIKAAFVLQKKLDEFIANEELGQDKAVISTKIEKIFEREIRKHLGKIADENVAYNGTNETIYNIVIDILDKQGYQSKISDAFDNISKERKNRSEELSFIFPEVWPTFFIDYTPGYFLPMFSIYLETKNHVEQNFFKSENTKAVSISENGTVTFTADAKQLQNKLSNLKMSANYVFSQKGCGTPPTPGVCWTSYEIIQYVDLALVSLANEYKYTKEAQKVLNDFRKELDEEIPKIYINEEIKGPIQATYSDRAKHHITMDFGIMNAFLDVDNGHERREFSLALYIGVAINLFAPVDKETPLKGECWPACLKRRLSLNIGYVITEFDDTDNTIKPLMGENAWMLGFGLRASDYIRLSFGGLLFNQKQYLNSDDYDYSVAPYLSLSVDSDVVGLIKNSTMKYK